MSSIILLNHGSAIHVVTDGAAYTPEGVMVELTQKVITIPHQNAGIFIRGPSRVVWQAGLLLAGQYESFDDLVDGLEYFLRDFYRKYFEAINSSGHPETEVYVFGWSDRSNATEAYLVRCAQPVSWMEDRAGESRYSDSPFKLVKIGQFAATPGPSIEDRQGGAVPQCGGDTAAP